jgi:hypothetical protein
MTSTESQGALAARQPAAIHFATFRLSGRFGDAFAVAFNFATLPVAPKTRPVDRDTADLLEGGMMERRDPVKAHSSRSMRSISFKSLIFSAFVTI